MELIKNIEKICEIWTRRTFSPIKRFDFLFKMTHDYKVQTEAMDIISSIVKEVIENSRKKDNSEEIKQKSIENDDNSNFLEWLIHQSKNGIYDINIEDEINTFIFAVRIRLIFHNLV